MADDSDRELGSKNYRYSSSYSNRSNTNPYSSKTQKKSSLKNTRFDSGNQFSDDDDDDDNLNSGRLSSRNRYDSPINSNRSDITAAKPPSGRLQPLSSSSSRNLGNNDYSVKKLASLSTSPYGDPYESSKSKNLPAITYDSRGKNDSDDELTDRYNKFTKKTNQENGKYDKLSSSKDSSSKFESKYDTYDEEDIKKEPLPSTKYFRSDNLLKGASGSKLEPLDDLYSGLKSSSPVKNPRSSSLDRLNSNTDYLLGTMNSTSSSKMQKFSSTSNINGNDNASDRSYTVNSLNNTTMSVREAKSRSFLVGSLSALNGKGLLSSDELDRHFLDRKARVLIATWNMGGIKRLPTNLDDLVLPDTIQIMPDVYVFGVQEFELNNKEWEISLQEQIGPSHVKLSSYYKGSSGVVLFIKRELIWFCSIVEYEHVDIKPKVSLIISFQLFGTLMCFICSHFASGEANLDLRIENYKTTIHNMKLPKRLLLKNRALSQDGTDNFDCVFWFGDFNFLVTKEKQESRLISRYKRGTTYEEVMSYEELNMVLMHDKAFKDFLEHRITFEPTYKYEINSDNFDPNSKLKAPSYCDRILYKSRQKDTISCWLYDSIKEIKWSSHRPVFGVFEVTIRPGVDKVPLSFGEFDRQVYAAGYEKRKMFRACDVGFDVKKKESPCTIQ